MPSPQGQRHVAEPPAFRAGHLALPVGPFHAHLALVEIDVGPFERHHLAASKAGLAAKKHDEVCPRIEGLRRYYQTLKGIEIVEPR